MSKIQALKTFLEDYAVFFEGLLEDEKNKLQTLMQGDLKAIEHTISIQQVNEKRIQNIEKKRELFQAEEGYANLTLKQIVDLFEGTEKHQLTTMYQRIQTAIQEVKYYNQKGIEVATTNLKLAGDSHKENTYSKESIQRK